MPANALTAKIRELRTEKKGPTLETILKIKITAEQQKDTSRSKAFYDVLLDDVRKDKQAY